MATRRRTPSEQRLNYGSDYRRSRARLLAQNPRCALGLPGCTGRATTADHYPALAEHDHLGDGAGCCWLRPACAHCNASAGGWRLANARRRRPPARIPPPSRDW